MSFPEIPLLIYPSLARRYGVEESLLFFLCTQLLSTNADNSLTVSSDKECQDNSLMQVILSKAKWLALTDFWHEDKLDQLSVSLHRQGAISIECGENQVVISEMDAATPSPVAVSSVANIPDESPASFPRPASTMPATLITGQFVGAKPPLPTESTHALPVYDVPPAPATRPLPKRLSADSVNSPRAVGSPNVFRSPNLPLVNDGKILKGIGPAPSFGGSTGWKKRSSDELQQVFAQQEEINKQLQGMSMDWKPSSMFYTSLTRNNIPHEFANNCLDEFMLFYCDKNKKERSWDQKFLAWVKRAWVKKQSSENRAISSQQQTGYSHENSQRDTREKRKRITAAIMDIHDTNW
ncbi:MAG: hypothetical protein OFPI_21570 [Osedax symbiont Rs2]|nr:MAG: hypothetical protein OFPI_21570 [Osedax symbiont Rs2]